MVQRTIYDLIDPCAAKHGGNACSVAAHDRVRPAKQSQRDRIREWLVEHPGHTREEIAGALGLKLSSVCGRVAELMGRTGGPVLVYESGIRRGEDGTPAALLYAQ